MRKFKKFYTQDSVIFVLKSNVILEFQMIVRKIKKIEKSVKNSCITA